MRDTTFAWRAGTLLAGAALLFSDAALAQAPAQQRKPAVVEEPSRTSATYDDWVVRCERGESTGGAKVCEVAQTLQIGNGQQQLVAQVVFGKLKPDAPLRLVLQLPVGVWLPGGTSLTVGDGAKPIPATYKFCINACIADADLTPQQAAALSAATGGATVNFQDRNQAQVNLPISIKGLSQALRCAGQDVSPYLRSQQPC